jgi:hypothetical protein
MDLFLPSADQTKQPNNTHGARHADVAAIVIA